MIIIRPTHNCAILHRVWTAENCEYSRPELAQMLRSLKISGCGVESDDTESRIIVLRHTGIHPVVHHEGINFTENRCGWQYQPQACRGGWHQLFLRLANNYHSLKSLETCLNLNYRNSFARVSQEQSKSSSEDLLINFAAARRLDSYLIYRNALHWVRQRLINKIAKLTIIHVSLSGCSPKVAENHSCPIE
jgi:hypothetical protein